MGGSGLAVYLEKTDWNQVDASKDAASFVAYLDRFEASPVSGQYRRHFCAHLPCREGERVLDAGCGVGGNARQLATRVGETGLVVGVDVSHQMGLRAKANSIVASNIAYGVGDIYHLPLVGCTFDGAVCDRVLMHLGQPIQALTEIVRTLRPGGWLGLCEPDWSKTRLEPDSRTARAVFAMHCANFANGAIGSRLPSLVEAAGCRLESELINSQAVREFEVVWPLLNVERTLRQAVREDILSAELVEDWRAEVDESVRTGTFCLHLTNAICISRREDG